MPVIGVPFTPYVATESVTEEAALKAYAHANLGTLATTLSMTVAGGSYDTIVEDALLEYGETDAAEITGVLEIKLVRACVRYHLWLTVTQITNGKFNLASGGDSLSLAQINEHARKSATDALAAIQRCREDLDYSTAWAANETGVGITEVSRSTDQIDIIAFEEDADDEFSA